MAEAASHRRGLKEALAPDKETVGTALFYSGALNRYDTGADAVRATDPDNESEIMEIAANEGRTLQARDLLNSQRSDAYDVAIAELLEEKILSTTVLSKHRRMIDPESPVLPNFLRKVLPA